MENELYKILQLLACGKALDTELFHNFATETAEIYIKHYSWYF